MSAPSLANAISKRPWLMRIMKPISNWYCNAAGYRALGLRADDLIPEESEEVLLALKRLPQQEAYDRVFRLRRAFQASLAHQLLPKAQQTKPEEDIAYLSPIIAEIEAEARERLDLESMTITKKK
ncbi:14 kDa protein of cytochrome bc1 complex (Ubiquinol-cytochrome c reductase) [Glarea lozoyensis ATCC 20868]|uniref:Cytochrome b-c1 complex subunit 7 n=1 Tax=Glarea lozoyensis (strain ATCC 20868 / MF5171) TaxID=1116229 RepID=S3DDY3_GLAL2|nr:14 kDa protein of cytochrome bc1 complex (Ubiquinol-cytochrome c reductase) [Glarea lozoyensis ATCC 20868]EPE35970.1 14 kDa protein of cytochrome bc1 complex (Ubiquinol-cytochrome c reductase) [Glarea lozoyensis ATCC 20868]